MTPGVDYEQVRIYITTFKNKNTETKSTESKNTMTEIPPNKRQNEMSNRFICSICLNSNSRECNNNKLGNRVSLSCPICRQSCVLNRRSDNNTFDNRDEIIRKPVKKVTTKTVQTSQTDVNQDLHLLKEVLTVFQNSKQVISKGNDRKTLTNDVSVETEAKNRSDKPQLARSRIFQCSIDENNGVNDTADFKIINFSQPNNVRSTQFAIDLSKRKSSSIPQMKMEELKYSLKEKTTSKDAVEEVNRMFATVSRNDGKSLEDCNRPLLRNGPRVLPVVKTTTYEHCRKKESTEWEVQKINENFHCKCCQNNNWQLSGGDSFFEHDCCYRRMLSKDSCDKCVYMMCCHYQKHSKMDCGALVCKHCNENEIEVKCDHMNNSHNF